MSQHRAWRRAVYEVIQTMTSSVPQGQVTIERLCRLARVSRAGYYRFWQASAPRQHDTAIGDAIQRLVLANGRYRRGHRYISLQRLVDAVQALERDETPPHLVYDAALNHFSHVDTFGEVIPDVLIGFAIYLPFALAGTYIGRRNHDRFIAKKLAQAEAKAKHTATYTASFTATTPQGPPAGWYNDPDGLLNIERYWDGTAWTDQRRNAASSSP